MDDYEHVVTSSLKLKGVSDHSIKKKKKKKKEKEKEKRRKEQILSSTGSEEPEGAASSSSGQTGDWRSKRTKAEIAFEKATAKRAAEEILKKASKTHKERIMDFNQHLDGLTEHFDIPKVSWTK